MTTPTYSVPIPKNFSQTNDFLSTVFLEAPDFDGLNQVVSYTITLDMMIDAVTQAISALAKKTRKPEAKALFEKCLDEIEIAHDLYKAKNHHDGALQIRAAQKTFQLAGKATRGEKPTVL